MPPAALTASAHASMASFDEPVVVPSGPLNVPTTPTGIIPAATCEFFAAPVEEELPAGEELHPAIRAAAATHEPAMRTMIFASSDSLHIWLKNARPEYSRRLADESGSDPFQDGGICLPAAFTHCLEAIPAAGAPQFVDHLRG